MNSDREDKSIFGESIIQSVKIAFAGLFLVTLVGFMVAALSTSEGSVGDTITTGLLWMYLGISVALPLLILMHTGYAAINWVRGDAGKTDPSTQLVGSSVLRAVEVGLAVLLLLVDVFYGYLFLTQPGGEGVGAVVLGGGLLLTLFGICLAVAVLADGIFSYTRSYTS